MPRDVSTAPTGKTRVLLLGSYNGQDSLGDGCLFQSVVDQLYHHIPSASITFHVHRQTALTHRLHQSHGVVAAPGLQTLGWQWRYYLRRLGVPALLAGWLAGISLPLAMIVGAAIHGTRWRDAMRAICGAELVVIFGGTNFARQWFWLNAPYYALTTIIAKLCGAKIAFSPQQFGPVTACQRWWLRRWIKLVGATYRVRNVRCAALLSDNTNADDALVWDEVYANVRLYPSSDTAAPSLSPSRVSKNTFQILLNVRDENFVSAGVFADSDAQWYSDLVATLSAWVTHHTSRTPQWRLFAVSGPGMADDTRMLHLVRQQVTDDIQLEVLPRFDSERQLVTLATASDLCLSMSFHGCVLAGMANIPAVPITEGGYYDYKYADFDRYGDGQEVPIIGPRVGAVDDAVRAVTDYMQRFSPRVAEKRRQAAATLAEAFYAEVAKQLTVVSPQSGSRRQCASGDSRV